MLRGQQKGALIKLLGKSGSNFEEIMIGLDHSHDFDVKECSIPLNEYPTITDVYMRQITEVPEEHSTYLHRKLKRYFLHGDIYASSLVMRNAGTAIMIGDTAFLEVHGEARKNGTTGYLWLEEEFFGTARELDHAIYKALAFEHALELIITDNVNISAQLSAYGVPSDKIKSTATVFKTVFE
jgi:hypothetical protein